MVFDDCEIGMIDDWISQFLNRLIDLLLSIGDFCCINPPDEEEDNVRFSLSEAVLEVVEREEKAFDEEDK